jgi:hypothetical protein
MISFFVAFGWNCFAYSNTATRTIMGFAWGLLAILVFWCIRTNWRRNFRYESGDSSAENGDAQSHASHPETESAKIPWRRTLGRMKMPQIRRIWPKFSLLGGRQAVYDSQRTAATAAASPPGEV